MTSKQQLFNIEKLKSYVGSDQNSLKEMVELFIVAASESLQEIKNAFENKDLEKLAKETHKIKPSLDIFSIKDLYQPIRELEQQAKDGEDFEDIKPCYDFVCEKMEEVIALMKKEI